MTLFWEAIYSFALIRIKSLHSGPIPSTSLPTGSSRPEIKIWLELPFLTTDKNLYLVREVNGERDIYIYTAKEGFFSLQQNPRGFLFPV